MLALVYNGPIEPSKRFELKKVPIPRYRKNKNSVLLEVIYTGICGTDLHIYSGNHPGNTGAILGHEIVGKVIDYVNKPKETRLKIGDKVTLDPNIICGICEPCITGNPNQCYGLKEGTTLGIFRNGGFAKYLVAPRKAIYKIPDDMDEKAAALSEPVSCVMNAIKQTNIQLEDTVLVIGAGPMGILTANLANYQSSRLLIAEIDDSRIEHAKKFVSKPEYVIKNEGNLEQRVMELNNGNKVDVIIEATGCSAEEAVSCIKDGGKVALLGMNEKARAEIKPFDITRYEYKVFGTFIAKHTFPSAIKVLYNNKIDVDNYVSDIVSLENIADGFRRLGLDIKTGDKTKREALKILVKP